MFAGHYAAGFLIKRKAAEIPLWLMFVAVQLVDIIAFTLVLLGVESISYNPSDNPFLRTSIDYVPYSHSLSSSLIIALAVFMAFWKLKGRVWGVALGIAVLSHWPIDYISHIPDMPLLFDRYKVGLGLWNYPWPAFLLEVGAFIAAGYWLYSGSKNLKRPAILMGLAVVLYSPVMLAPEGEAPVAVVCITSLSLYAIFALMAWWVERARPMDETPS